MMPRIKFAVGLAVILIQIWLYINADAIYGPYAGMVRNTMLAYFLLIAVFSPFVMKSLLRLGPQDLPNFTIMFILTSAVLMIVPAVTHLVTGEIEQGLTLALGFGFLHSFVKAFNEELIFRDVLPSIMGNGMVASIYVDIVSSLAFGVFHLAVTNVNILAMLFLSALGFVWSQVYKRFGLMGSTGSHIAYNLAVLGVLPKMFGG